VLISRTERSICEMQGSSIQALRCAASDVRHTSTGYSTQLHHTSVALHALHFLNTSFTQHCGYCSVTGSQETLQTATAAHAAAAKAAAAQAAEAAIAVLPPAAACHIEQGAEYSGDVVKWGESHLKVRRQPWTERASGRMAAPCMHRRSRSNCQHSQLTAEYSSVSLDILEIAAYERRGACHTSNCQVAGC
jgi:hypothetical protein